jgi:hypothetical protein
LIGRATADRSSVSAYYHSVPFLQPLGIGCEKPTLHRPGVIPIG